MESEACILLPTLVPVTFVGLVMNIQPVHVMLHFKHAQGPSLGEPPTTDQRKAPGTSHKLHNMTHGTDDPRKNNGQRHS